MEFLKNIRIGILILTGCLLFIAGGCQKDEKIVKDKVLGSVQKGPFVNGTSIVMSELSPALLQTGKTFNTEILNNAGTFEIPDVTLSSSFVEFSATGYYYDEIIGEVSISPLTLLAISDITDISTVNVNILTHLEKQRVKYLIDNGISFAEAKSTAQEEILGIFGFSHSGMNTSESLDISVNSSGNAILLAISVLLQGDRSVGDMTELMANISNDIREDGILDDEAIVEDLRTTAAPLNLASIRSNLESRYQELGVPATIPDFEGYINDFLEFTGDIPAIISRSATKVYTVSATLRGDICPNSLSTNVVFEYGLTDSYGSSVQAVQNPLTGYYSAEATGDITGLTPMTQYHFRIHATNSKGDVYSQDATFVTSDPANIAVDRDGYSYRSVVIGSQVWMAENLRTTKYSDGTPIPKITDNNAWATLTSPGYCWYNNDSVTYHEPYGALYNFHAVNTGKLCPDGWHVPTDAEWTTLSDNLGGYQVAGGKMKEAGYSHWSQPNILATNESGFTTVPNGVRTLPNGFFGSMGFGCEIWSSTTNDAFSSYTRHNDYQTGWMPRNIGPYSLGASVRCVKDSSK